MQRRNPRSRPRSILRLPNALTLVEVAVVVAALAVLTALLVPAVASAGRSSKYSRCLGNLKQIGYANLVYSSEDAENMALPVHRLMFQQERNQPTYIGAYEWGGKSGVGRARYFGDPPDPLNSKYGTRAGFGPATRPLNITLYGDVFADYTDDPGDNNENWRSDTQLDLDLFECPSDSGYTGVHDRDFRDSKNTSYDHFGTSYTANMFMTGASNGQGFQSSNSPYLHRMSDIISPARTLAYYENNGRFAWAAEPDPCPILGVNGIPGVVRGWHGKDWTFNAAFMDGHAEDIYMRQYTIERLLRVPEGAEWEDFRCIIIRGEGWQKDTLPAARVSSGLAGRSGGRSSYEDMVSP